MKNHLLPPSRRTSVSLVIAAAMASLAAHGEELVLNPVVVTGSRVEHASFDLPASVDVVDQSRIGAGQAKVNLSEALAGVPGITVLNRQNYAQDLQISSRGFGARSAFGVRGIKLITDGIPASTPDGQGQAATFNLDVAERIEVLRGPNSVLYGNNAGGVVQMFSRNPGKEPALTGSVSAGNSGTIKTNVGAEGHVGDIGYVLDTSDFSTDGYRYHSAANRRQSFAKLLIPIGDDSLLTLVGNSLRQDNTQDPQGIDWATAISNPRSVSATTLSYNVRKSIDHLQGGATFEKTFASSTLSLSAYSGTRHVTQFQSIPRANQLLPGNPTSPGGVIDFDRNFEGLAARWSRKDDMAGGVLTSTAGLDIDRSQDDRKGYENYLSATTLGVKGALRRNEMDTVTSTDPYLQLEWSKGPWLLSGGLRHSKVNFNVKDKYFATGNGDDSGSVSYSKTTPSAGLLYRLTERTNIYASAGRGFEAPTFNELFYSGPGSSFSFTLQPATSRHLETGLKALLGDSTRINAALFRIDTDKELVVDTSLGGRTSYKNAGRTLRTGLELSLYTAWSGGFTGKLALTTLRATYEDAFLSNGNTIPAGNKLPGVPDSSLFGEVAWKSASGLNAGVELVGQGRIFVEDTNTKAAAPGYALVNLRVGLEQKSGAWQLREFIRLNNAFDRRYIGSVIVGDSNSRYYEPAPGQNWLIGASVRYSY